MKNTTYLQVICAALFFMLSTVHLQAQVVLGTYEFDNTNGTNSAPADKAVSNQVANVTLSNFFTVGAIETNSDKGAGNANRLATFGWNLGNQDWSDTLYIGFTVTAPPGFTLNLDSLSLDYNRVDRTNSPRDGRMLVGTGGISTATPFTLFSDSNSAPNADVSFGPVDLSALNGETSYNFYFQFSDADVFTRIIRIDNVELAGTVIPEPSSSAFLLLGLVALIGLNRRKNP